jgi:hypothetical protein
MHYPRLEKLESYFLDRSRRFAFWFTTFKHVYGALIEAGHILFSLTFSIRGWLWNS